MDTSMGLSSIASLSLGLSMSMTGAGAGTIMMRSLAMRPTIHHHGRGGAFHGAASAHGSGHAVTNRAFPDNPGTRGGGQLSTGGLHHQVSASTGLHPTSGQSEDSSCCLVQLDEEPDEDRTSMDFLTVHSDPKTDDLISRSPSLPESIPSIEQTLSSAISLMTSCTNGQTPGQESVGFRLWDRKSPSRDAVEGQTFARRTWTSEGYLTSRHATADRSLRRVGSQLPPGLARPVDTSTAADLPPERLDYRRPRPHPSFGFKSTGVFSASDHATLDMRPRSYLMQNRDSLTPKRTDPQFQVTSPLNSKRRSIPTSTYGATTDEVQQIHRIRSVEDAGTYDDSRPSAKNPNPLRPQPVPDQLSFFTPDGRKVPPFGRMKSAPNDRTCGTISGFVVAESVSMDRHASPVDPQVCRKKVDGLGAIENGSAPALILSVQRKTMANTTGEPMHDDKVAIFIVRSFGH